MTFKGLTVDGPTIGDARTAVSDFLRQSLPEVHRVNVTKLVQIDAEEGTWEADAEVWQPNATIQALGLPISNPVLDQNEYLVRLDGQLNVIAYAEKESIEDKE